MQIRREYNWPIFAAPRIADMQYNVAQLLKEPMGSVRIFQVEAGQVEVLSPVKDIWGGVRMVRTHQGVLVNAELEVASVVTCSRCVDDCDRVSTLNIEEEFFPTIDLHTGRRVALVEEDEDALQIGEDHLLDLTEVIRQYAISDQPMKPLCRAECLGLCLECGADLNRSGCACNEAPIDPRWGALAGLQDLRN